MISLMKQQEIRAMSDSSEGASKRERGILTPADREYLRDEIELTPDSERNAQRRIRNRLREAIIDMSLLFDKLPSQEIEKVFASSDTPNRYVPADVRDGMIDAIALFVVGCYEAEKAYTGPPGMSEEEYDQLRDSARRLDSILNGGLRKGGERCGLSFDHVHIESPDDRPDINDIIRRYYRGDRISFSEFERMQREGATIDLREEAYVRHRAAGSGKDRIKFEGEETIAKEDQVEFSRVSRDDEENSSDDA